MKIENVSMYANFIDSKNNFFNTVSSEELANSIFNENNINKKTNIEKCDFFENNAEKQKDLLQTKDELKQIKAQQGLIGKVWDGFKNLTRIGASSNKAQKAIEEYEIGLISKDEMKKAVDNYKEGQQTSVDVVADILSGIFSVGIFAFAVPTVGASLAFGLGLATAVGAGIKIGIKASDSIFTNKKYSKKELLYDFATGAINGLMGPITNGIGNTVTKTIATKIIKESAEETVEQVAKQTLKQLAKNVILNQTDDIIGGTVFKRAVAQGAGMAVDGALGGASDNIVRATLDGENIIKAGIEGAIGGLIISPIVGGGMKALGNAGNLLNSKITFSKLLPDGLSTKFKQGSVGDCALLSIIDGLMNNQTTAKNLKKSITKTIGGDYNVKIGNKIVQVSKKTLTDEMLSDATGIRIFEQAYKQINGNIDGGFAETIAKQFGLYPLHVANEQITDEFLDKLAKNQKDLVLSFGSFVDSEGAISNIGSSRHYFTVKNIDSSAKKIILTSPLDTSQEIKLSYDQIKQFGISIDGGSIKQLGLPNAARDINEGKFYGVNQSKVKANIEVCLELIGFSDKTKYFYDDFLNFLCSVKIDDDELLDEVKMAKLYDDYLIKNYSAIFKDLKNKCANIEKYNELIQNFSIEKILFFEKLIKENDLDYKTISANKAGAKGISAAYKALDELLEYFNSICPKNATTSPKDALINFLLKFQACRKNGLLPNGNETLDMFLETVKKNGELDIAKLAKYIMEINSVGTIKLSDLPFVIDENIARKIITEQVAVNPNASIGFGFYKQMLVNGIDILQIVNELKINTASEYQNFKASLPSDLLQILQNLENGILSPAELHNTNFHDLCENLAQYVATAYQHSDDMFMVIKNVYDTPSIYKASNGNNLTNAQLVEYIINNSTGFPNSPYSLHSRMRVFARRKSYICDRQNGYSLINGYNLFYDFFNQIQKDKKSLNDYIFTLIAPNQWQITKNGKEIITMVADISNSRIITLY